MDDRQPPGMVNCPPAEAAPDADFPGEEREPRVDERLATPESRFEYLEGVEMFVAPADEPHATQQSQITRVMGSHVAQGYVPAVEMLTRTSATSDFAPDFSIFPAARDPKTGGRRLEEIAFEVASEQALSVPTRKARELARRGVRRVFCLLVKQRRVLEWSRETDGWEPLPEDGTITDPTLVRPLPIAALLDAAKADDAVALALLAKKTPALVQAIEEGHKEGRKEGVLDQAREAVLDVLCERGIVVPERVRAVITASTDLAELKRWRRRAVRVQAAEELLSDAR